jgi:hypothetical protein
LADDVITIGLGNAVGQIGYDAGEGEIWKPVFFAVDLNGNVHVPDFYKDRIAIFDSKGQLKAAIACNSGLSPSMSYFSLTPDGSYVTFDSSVLYLLERTGKMRWRYQFPLGTFLEGIYLGTKNAQLLPIATKEQGISVSFDYAGGQPSIDRGKILGGRTLTILWDLGKSEFTEILSDMALLAGNDRYLPPNADKKYRLLKVTVDGMSVWSDNEGGWERILAFDAQGILMKSRTIAFDHLTSGSGFWSYVTEDLKLYKVYFTEKAMEIHIYDLNR